MGKNGQAREVGKLVIVFFVTEARGSSAGPVRRLSWKRGGGEADFYGDESCKNRAVSAALTKGCSASDWLIAFVHNSTSSLISRIAS